MRDVDAIPVTSVVQIPAMVIAALDALTEEFQGAQELLRSHIHDILHECDSDEERVIVFAKILEAIKKNRECIENAVCCGVVPGVTRVPSFFVHDWELTMESRRVFQKGVIESLQTLCRSRGITQKSLAHALGLKQTTVSGLLRGTCLGSVEVLKKLALWVWEQQHADARA